MSARSIYLISPRNDGPSIYSLEGLAAAGLRVQNVGDLAATTVAALVPDDFEVMLCDAAISDVDLETSADFVALTGKAGQVFRMVTLARELRRRGAVVIAGGPFASLSPDFLSELCDIVVVGELEGIADELFSDLRRGSWKPRYVGPRIDLAMSPAPRWDLYPNHRTLAASLQTSRGCPFECEFCDVILYLGRKQRHKPVEAVLEELQGLYDLGHRTVFLADDNLTASIHRAKDLAAAIAQWNGTRPRGRVRLISQVSIEVTRDDEHLELWADAGLVHTFVGIETPNPESLREANKRPNLRRDLVADVARLVAHGIGVLGGMIVGFDSDGRDIFERQFDFAMETAIPIFALNTLVAPPGTPLDTRLESEGRIRSDPAGFMLGRTNFVPAMGAEELKIGFKWLANKLFAADAFADRLLRFLDQIDVRPWDTDGSLTAIQREVDGVVLESLTQLGAREAQMVRKVGRKLDAKPEARFVTLEWLRYYYQLRYAYAKGGIWTSESLGDAPFD